MNGPTVDTTHKEIRLITLWGGLHNGTVEREHGVLSFDVLFLVLPALL